LGRRKSKEVDGCFRHTAETESNALCSDVVEMRRIELLIHKLDNAVIERFVGDKGREITHPITHF